MQASNLLSKPVLRRVSLLIMVIAVALTAFGLYRINSLSSKYNELMALIDKVRPSIDPNNPAANTALQGQLLAIDSDVRAVERQQGEATVQTGLAAALFGIALIGYLWFADTVDTKKSAAH